MQKRASRALTASWLCAVLAWGASCADRTPSAQSPPSPDPRDDARSPALVVSVVVDQLASWTFERYQPLLPDDGFFRRATQHGAYVPRVAYPQANTSTAAGHTTIYTGVAAAEHGAVANRVWRRQRNATVPAFDDGVHEVHGREGSYASPAAIATETVADALYRQSDGRARTLSISLKDRGAIPGGGSNAEAVLWYDPNQGRFTSSDYYGDLPSWLSDWQAERPLDTWLEPWSPLDEASLASELGPDGRPGEGDYLGLDAKFPHDPRQTEDPKSAFRLMPASTNAIFDLALRGVRDLELGSRGEAELLALAISANDYVGHTFGPESWEYVDALIRLDRDLADFVDALEDEVGAVSVLVTSDHGVARLPEASGADGYASGRLFSDEVEAALEDALTGALGTGDWISAFSSPFVYLTERARDPELRDESIRVAKETLEELPGVHAAYGVRDEDMLRASSESLERAVFLSLGGDVEPDVYVVLERHYTLDAGMPRGFGSNHGSPWRYDREVPVFAAGPEVPSFTSADAPSDMRQVAATLARLLDIERPEGAAEALWSE